MRASPRRFAARAVLATAAAAGAFLLLAGCGKDPQAGRQAAQSSSGKRPASATPDAGKPGRRPARPAAPQAPPEPFRDVAAELGITRPNVCGSPGLLFILENIGSGAAFLDHDGDGRLDIFINNAGTTRILPGPPKRVQLVEGPGASLYRQEAGGRFRDVTERAGVRFTGWGTGVAVGDVDNDGDPDLFVGAFGKSRFYVNQGDGTFRESSKAAGLDRPGYATSAAFVDYDKDGFLDLYVVNYLVFDPDHPPNNGEPCYRGDVIISCGPTMHPDMADVLYHNRGDGTFEDVTKKAGMLPQRGAYGLGIAVGDLDRDGWPDIYVTNDTQANFYWHNQGGGTFQDAALLGGIALSENAQGQSGMGVDFGDIDGDGWLDIIVSNYSEEPNAYYRNLRDGSFSDESSRSGIAPATFMYLVWGTKLFDYDHDGTLDFVTVGGHVHPRAPELAPRLRFQQRILVFHGEGGGKFSDATNELGSVLLERRNHRGLAVADVDRDGDVDMLVTLLDGPPLLLENNVRKKGSSVVFRLEGSASNRDAIGARVEIDAGGRRLVREVTRSGSYLSACDPAVHFGTGAARKIESVRILWPSGKKTKLGPIDAGTAYKIYESDGRMEPLWR